MKQTLLRIFVCVTCLATPARMTAAVVTRPAPQPAPDGERFLFIADISEDMERLKAANESAIYDLLLGGLYGYMRDGDSYGIWTFNKETYTGRLPLQVWETRKPNQLATIAAAFLSGQFYEKSSDVKQMMTQLTSIIQSVSNLTVFIISDGSSAMQGTPFDRRIAAEYKQRRRERNSAKRPFVTTLIVRDGRIAGYSVVVAGQPIQLPQRPLPAVAGPTAPPPDRPAGIVLSNTPLDAAVANASAAPAQIPTNSATPADPAVALSKASPNVFPTPTNFVAGPGAVSLTEAAVPPRRAPVMQIVTKSNSLPTALSSAAPTRIETNAMAAGVIQTNASEARAISPIAAAAAVAPALSVVELKSKATTAEESFRSLLPPTITVAAREVSTATAKPEPPAAMEATVLPPPRAGADSWMLTFAVVLLALVLMLLLVVLRRLRPTPGSSLITQSMERR